MSPFRTMSPLCENVKDAGVMITRGHVLLGLSVVTVVALAGPAPARAQPATPATVYGGRISSTVVMLRAADWLRRDIPYSQDNRKARWDRNRGRAYRPDCSGFVSMAWAIETRRPGPDRALVTWELPGVSTPIAWARLRPGDILLRLVPGNRAKGHVVLFQAWADKTRTRAWIIEENGPRYGMRRKTVTVAGVRNAFRPYRYRRIV